jgi:hypothetical protein
LRESGLGAVADTTLLVGDLPVVVGYIHNGTGKQQGLVGRAGASFGLSTAIGRHFGIGGTALTQIRPPEESPGIGRGHRLVVGADVEHSFGGFTTSVEYMWLRNGETVADVDEEVLNMRAQYQFPFGPQIEGEVTYAFRDPSVNFRLAAQLAAAEKVFFVPSVRYYENYGWRIGIGLRIRL